MYLILFVDRVNIATAAPLIKLDLRLSNTQLGLVFSAFAIPCAVFQLLGSWIGDKFGPRLILTVCCAIVGVATILTGLAVCLSLAFFCAELIVAPIWSVPMDIAPPYAGTASGMMNTGFAVAPDLTGAGVCHRRLGRAPGGCARGL